jgi:hypothetical protein
LPFAPQISFSRSFEMENHEDLDHDEIVTDLGAASEVTLGVWDPIFKENFVSPHMRDM